MDIDPAALAQIDQCLAAANTTFDTLIDVLSKHLSEGDDMIEVLSNTKQAVDAAFPDHDVLGWSFAVLLLRVVLSDNTPPSH